MSFARIDSGKRGELLAISYLKKLGYKIVAKNYKTNLGEIDLIARDRDTVCFIEVRSKNSPDFGLAEETITGKKKTQISKAALGYIKRFGLEDYSCRFDVVCIQNVNTSEPEIKLIKNAFELADRYSY